MARKPSLLQTHQVTVKQHNGAYRADCSCGEQLGTNLYDRDMGRRAGQKHQRRVAPHLCGPRS